MKRQANPQLSLAGEAALTQYKQALRTQEDLALASIRNYLSDLRHFIAWYETRFAGMSDEVFPGAVFDQQAISCP